MNNIKEMPLVIYGMINKDEVVFFYNFTYGCIVEINTKTSKIRIRWVNESECFPYMDMYGGAKIDSGRIVFAPRCADSILLYNLNDETADYIPYKATPLLEGGRANQFVDVHVYKNYYYFFPGRNDEIVKVNRDSQEVSYIDGWAEELGEMPNPNSVKFNSVTRIDEHICMLPCFQKGVVMEFDMETDRWVLHNVYDGELSDIVYDGEYYWISVREKKRLLRWKPLDGSEMVEEFVIESENEESRGFIHIIAGDNCILLIPFLGKYIYRFNKESAEVTQIEVWNDTDCCEKLKEVNPANVNTFSCLRVSPEENYIYDALHGRLLEINADKISIKRIELKLPEDEYAMLNKAFLRARLLSPCVENEELGLTELIEVIE